MDDNLKQTLLDRFGAWLDQTEDAPVLPDDPQETADLYAVFVEVAALRTEVRTESRLVKDALEQFRGTFETLQASHATLQRELDRARSETREQRRAALRPLLLDVLDLRDRLAAALKMPAAPRLRWPQRLWRRPSGQGEGEAWQEGLRMLLDRFDHVLQGRGVQTMQLIGQPFNPQLARVIGTAASPAAADGLVLEEVRAGYFWESQVLRTAEVIVSKAGTGQGEPS